jgi:hypothetical protein
MSDSQVSVGAALGYAWSLWRSHWRQIWGILALNGLACTVFFAGLFAQNLDLLVAAEVGLLFTMYSTYGAVIRVALGADHPDDPEFRLGNLGLQWRMMELRMLGSQALLLIFLVILAMLMSVALLAPVLGYVMSTTAKLPSTQEELQRVLGPNGIQAVNLAYSVMQLILMGVALRLSLNMVATGDRKKVSMLRTWKLTRGHFFQLLGATVVLGLPTVLIISVGFSAGLALDGRPSPLAPGETFIYSLVCGAWAGAAAMPLAAGVQAYFYRNLKTAD